MGLGTFWSKRVNRPPDLLISLAVVALFLGLQQQIYKSLCLPAIFKNMLRCWQGQSQNVRDLSKLLRSNVYGYPAPSERGRSLRGGTKPRCWIQQ